MKMTEKEREQKQAGDQTERQGRDFNTFSQRLVTFSAAGLTIGGVISGTLGGGIGLAIGALTGLGFWLNEDESSKPQYDRQ
ncbi:hypothetical protein [Dactylococcopsis salina]|uniref:Uncharacterized protein n=1 Tax=Dactylococcopsis salina (strain PCC 8305) TaxID=13035 RepID=K9YTL1_DACS8|nr:hypothetical protein [Dactylococcopsis salina]AFZ50219.1 hypothetical protein Dacsa_1535 [Dactylococcopsis salina PCC 8305]